MPKRKHKEKPKSDSPYEIDTSLRKKQLLEDIEKDEKLIKKLEKKLRMKTSNGKKAKSFPLWMKESGFDDDIDKYKDEVSSDESDIDYTVKKKKKPQVDIYGQSLASDEDCEDDSSEDENSAGDVNESLKTDEDSIGNNFDPVLTRKLKICLNTVSEASMGNSVENMNAIFDAWPKGIVRELLVNELTFFIKNTCVSTRDSNIGWMQQELAVFIACICLTRGANKQQESHLIGYLLESLTKILLDDNSSNDMISSVYIFLAFLYRFSILEVAKILGLHTPFKQRIFHILVSSNGDAESVVEKILKACKEVGKGENLEREALNVVMQSLIAEQPYNTFYSKVLGEFLNYHHRFMMILKCIVWDILKREDLEDEAKENCATGCAFLSNVYQFPLNFLKKFDFGDDSSGNLVFLKTFVRLMCQTDFVRFCEQLERLLDTPKLCRNLRIFVRRNMIKENDDATELNVYKRVVEILRDVDI